MPRIAVIVDGGFVRSNLQKKNNGNRPDANQIYQTITGALSTHLSRYEIFRIFYYDSLAVDIDEKTYLHPLTGKVVNLLDDIDADYSDKLYTELKRRDNVAFRYGELGFSGWRLRKQTAFIKKVKNKEEIVEADFCINVKQKGVDLKMGLDIAWISMKSIVDAILIISADSDLVPAMKFARKEGLNVYLATLGTGVKPSLVEHSDKHFK